jgi:hypothetical protein
MKGRKRKKEEEKIRERCPKRARKNKRRAIGTRTMSKVKKSTNKRKMLKPQKKNPPTISKRSANLINWSQREMKCRKKTNKRNKEMVKSSPINNKTMKKKKRKAIKKAIMNRLMTERWKRKRKMEMKINKRMKIRRKRREGNPNSIILPTAEEISTQTMKFLTMKNSLPHKRTMKAIRSKVKVKETKVQAIPFIT